MAKRFTKPTINWVELDKRVPKEQKANFMAFKGRSDVYLRRVTSNPPELPKIDWAKYAKIVPIPGLVEKFQKEYESAKVPFPTDTQTAEIEKQWSEMQGEIKSYCADQQKSIDAANKELTRIKALPSYDEMTMEMYADMFPESALDPVNKPSFWPHNKEEQPGYQTPEQQASKALRSQPNC